MSKSDPNMKSCIHLIDTSDDIRRKIRKAKTDSLSGISYQPKERPELANLLRIYSSLDEVPISFITDKYKNSKMTTFKEGLSDLLVDKICPIGEKTMDLYEN